jgi:hypothetical protein
MVGLGTAESSNLTNDIWHLSLPFGHYSIDNQKVFLYTCMMQNNSWTVILEEDPETGDLIMPLPEDFLETQGWKEGDTLEWIDNKDGSWILQKSTKNT